MLFAYGKPTSNDDAMANTVHTLPMPEVINRAQANHYTGQYYTGQQLSTDVFTIQISSQQNIIN